MCFRELGLEFTFCCLLAETCWTQLLRTGQGLSSLSFGLGRCNIIYSPYWPWRYSLGTRPHCNKWGPESTFLILFKYALQCSADANMKPQQPKLAKSSRYLPKLQSVQNKIPPLCLLNVHCGAAAEGYILVVVCRLDARYTHTLQSEPQICIYLHKGNLWNAVFPLHVSQHSI